MRTEKLGAAVVVWILIPCVEKYLEHWVTVPMDLPSTSGLFLQTEQDFPAQCRQNDI